MRPPTLCYAWLCHCEKIPTHAGFGHGLLDSRTPWFWVMYYRSCSIMRRYRRISDISLLVSARRLIVTCHVIANNKLNNVQWSCLKKYLQLKTSWYRFDMQQQQWTTHRSSQMCTSVYGSSLMYGKQKCNTRRRPTQFHIFGAGYHEPQTHQLEHAR